MMVKLESGQGQVDDRRASRAAGHSGLRASRPQAAVRAQDRRLQGSGARRGGGAQHDRRRARARRRGRRRRAARMRAERGWRARSRALDVPVIGIGAGPASTVRFSCSTTSSASRRGACRASCRTSWPAATPCSRRCVRT